MSGLLVKALAAGTLIDPLDAPARLIHLRALDNIASVLVLKDALGGTVVSIPSHIADATGSEIPVPPSVSSRIFGKSVRLGANSVPNFGFDADELWTKGTGWTIAGGVADCDGSQIASSDLYVAVGVASGTWYRLTFTMTRSAGTLTPYVGGSAGTARSTSATFVEYVKGGSADARITLQAGATFVGTLDNVLVEAVQNADAILEVSSITATFIASLELA